ncbi:MAG TPA: DNA-binding transcriptional regulator [Planctomycetota bacterium]|nr:DNA-binding transcriptional regulator [Planctomycetota bacterium]
MRKRRSVALLIETSNAYARGLLAGIMAYVRQHQPWSIYLPELGRGDVPPRWRGDGIIARIETKAIARAVTRTGLPVVDLSAGRHVKSVPWLETDDVAIARTAMEHLLERGFRHLAFCGERRFNWSRWRAEQFQKLAREKGVSVDVYESSGTDPWAKEHQALLSWVRKLPRPVGIMACYDIKAQQLLDVCRENGVAVPEEIAVIGVDNDPLLCSLTSPPLTSVIPNTHRTGYEAASLLDRMMSGEKLSPRGHLIPPIGVETRQSTDVLALADREIAAAVRFIREHACDGATIGDLLRVVPLSRRVMESRYRKATGRTPHQDLVRFRIDRVKQLLAETEHSLERIATLAGFDHPEYMSVAFKRETRTTPGKFRLQAKPRETGKH